MRQYNKNTDHRKSSAFVLARKYGVAQYDRAPKKVQSIMDVAVGKGKKTGFIVRNGKQLYCVLMQSPITMKWEIVPFVEREVPCAH